MSTTVLDKYVGPLLDVPHIETIRFGTKVIGFWPYRLLGTDGDDLMRLIDRIIQRGKTAAFMLHLNHPRELETDGARRAISRLRNAGALLWGQTPLLRGVNDSPDVLAQ